MVNTYKKFLWMRKKFIMLHLLTPLYDTFAVVELCMGTQPKLKCLWFNKLGNGICTYIILTILLCYKRFWPFFDSKWFTTEEQYIFNCILILEIVSTYTNKTLAIQYLSLQAICLLITLEFFSRIYIWFSSQVPQSFIPFPGILFSYFTLQIQSYWHETLMIIEKEFKSCYFKVRNWVV